MKRIGSIAAVALLAAASAYAQTQYEPAVPRAIPDSSGPQSRELVQPTQTAPAGQVVEPVVPRLVMDRTRGHNDTDVRRCLQFASNKQIHRCAERYRPHASHASVTRTKAAKASEAVAPAARAKAADLGKPDLSKAASPGKTAGTAKPAIAPPSTTAAAVQKPAATPAPAAPEKPAAKTADRPPKWTDSAKGVMKSRGEHLPE
jgi:hypothetical protein